MLFHCKETAAVRKYFQFLSGQKRLLAVYLSLGFRRFIKQFQPKAVKDFKVNPSLCNTKLYLGRHILISRIRLKSCYFCLKSQTSSGLSTPRLMHIGKKPSAFQLCPFIPAGFIAGQGTQVHFCRLIAQKVVLTKYVSLSQPSKGDCSRQSWGNSSKPKIIWLFCLFSGIPWYCCK